MPKKEKKKSADVDGGEIFEVESILYFFEAKWLVKWKGYSIEECTWEPKENLVNCEEKVDKYVEERRKVEYLLSDEDVELYNKSKPPKFKLLDIIRKRRKKRMRNKIWYEVKWKGIPIITLEPEDYLSQHQPKSFEKFKNQVKAIKNNRAASKEIRKQQRQRRKLKKM